MRVLECMCVYIYVCMHAYQNGCVIVCMPRHFLLCTCACMHTCVFLNSCEYNNGNCSWASVSEPHTCDFNATFSLYIYIVICICDRHCTSKIAINISIFHLGSYTRRARIVPRRGAVGPTHFRSHGHRGPSCELTCSLCSSGIV